MLIDDLEPEPGEGVLKWVFLVDTICTVAVAAAFR